MSGFRPVTVLILSGSVVHSPYARNLRTVTVTINADDPRTIKAIEIAADAGQWLPCRTADGADAYRVPSQGRRDCFYVVTESTCNCPDFLHSEPETETESEPGEQRACKHVLAVRLHHELMRAVERHAELRSTRRGGHLRLLPSISHTPS